MELKLWAPWRINYVNKNKPQGYGLASFGQSQKKQKGCIFCQAKNIPKSDYVIFKTSKSICLMNIYPYNNGHLMIAPLRHFSDITNSTEAEILDMFKCLKKAKALLKKVLKPHGFNLGFNLGRASGAGITGHLHLHIVPRWIGDTNFMPAICSTKVISQSLDQLAKLLKKCL